MPGVSKEQIAAAKRMSAIEFLQTYRPDELVRCGNGEFQLQSHDSFKINEYSSVWHWKSRGQGGKSALDYLIYVESLPFIVAVRALANENPAYLPKPHAEIEAQQKMFVLPPKDANTFRVETYLQSRGISQEVIRYCIDADIVYESLPYHNAVFVGRDEDGTARYAALRGTFPNVRTAFKCEASGSDKRYGFCIPPKVATTQLTIYEAAPDAMAHASLEANSFGKWRLSLGGIYAPQPNTDGQIKPMKPPVALEQFLLQHPEIIGIEVCFDNDARGRAAAEQIALLYGAHYNVKQNLPTIENADYADLAQMRLSTKFQKPQRQKVRNNYAR